MQITHFLKDIIKCFRRRFIGRTKLHNIHRNKANQVPKRDLCGSFRICRLDYIKINSHYSITWKYLCESAFSPQSPQQADVMQTGGDG